MSFKHDKKQSKKSEEKQKLKEEKRKQKKEKKRLKKEKKKNKKSKKKNTSKKSSEKSTDGPKRVSEKEHLFSDVKLFRVMPILFVLSFVFLAAGWGGMAYNTHKYNVAQGRVSMKQGETLPLYYGTQENQQKGTLKIGRSILSKDHKQMAVSIQYDSDAHQNLSAFGNEYKLFFVCTPKYPAQNIHVKYGFFGTDGNGVLQITSDKPFVNEAFDIIMVDKQDLISNNESLGGSDSNNMDSDQLDKSITAQLSNGALANNTSGNANATSNSVLAGKHWPASYYIRLNPYSAKQVDLNWGNNELKLVDNLFVKHNLTKIQNSIESEKTQLKQANNTLAEYNHRLAINPNDAYAQEGKENIEEQISGLQDDIRKDEKNFETIKKARLSKEILGEEANTYKLLRTPSLDRVQTIGGSGSGS